MAGGASSYVRNTGSLRTSQSCMPLGFQEILFKKESIG